GKNHVVDAPAMTLPEDGLRILCALTTWQAPSTLAKRLGLDEAEVAAWLVVFALNDLATYADFDTGRTFPGGLLDAKATRVALLDCVFVDLLVDRGYGAENRVFMPRMGELDEIAAVGMSFFVNRRGERVARVRLASGTDLFRALSAVVPLLDG